MKANRWLIGCAAVACLALAATAVRSEDKPADPSGHQASSPEEQKMMEAYQKAGTPGPEHERVMKMAGNWTAEIEFHHKPGDEPNKSAGTAVFTPILGGRFLQEEFKSDMGGMPFEGRGLSGYDNVQKKYIAIWMDSMTTGAMLMTGDWDESLKGVVFHGEETDPTGAKWKLRSVAREESPTKHVYEMYKTGADGKEFKALQVTYTKAA